MQESHRRHRCTQPHLKKCLFRCSYSLQPPSCKGACTTDPALETIGTKRTLRLVCLPARPEYTWLPLMTCPSTSMGKSSQNSKKSRVKLLGATFSSAYRRSIPGIRFCPQASVRCSATRPEPPSGSPSWRRDPHGAQSGAPRSEDDVADLDKHGERVSSRRSRVYRPLFDPLSCRTHFLTLLRWGEGKVNSHNLTANT